MIEGARASTASYRNARLQSPRRLPSTNRPARACVCRDQEMPARRAIGGAASLARPQAWSSNFRVRFGSAGYLFLGDRELDTMRIEEGMDDFRMNPQADVKELVLDSLSAALRNLWAEAQC